MIINQLKLKKYPSLEADTKDKESFGWYELILWSVIVAISTLFWMLDLQHDRMAQKAAMFKAQLHDCRKEKNYLVHPATLSTPNEVNL